MEDALSMSALHSLYVCIEYNLYEILQSHTQHVGSHAEMMLHAGHANYHFCPLLTLLMNISWKLKADYSKQITGLLS